MVLLLVAKWIVRARFFSTHRLRSQDSVVVLLVVNTTHTRQCATRSDGHACFPLCGTSVQVTRSKAAICRRACRRAARRQLPTLFIVLIAIVGATSFVAEVEDFGQPRTGWACCDLTPSANLRSTNLDAIGVGCTYVCLTGIDDASFHHPKLNEAVGKRVILEAPDKKHKHKRNELFRF